MTTAARRPRVPHAAALAAALVLAVACGAPSRAPASTPSGIADPVAARDGGVSLAENAGPTLVVLSLDPARPGSNTVRVDLRDPGGALVPGAVRVDLTLDGADSASTTLAGDRRGSLTVARAGHTELRVTVRDGKSAGATIGFALDLPTASVPDGTLGDIDRAMQVLRTLREVQTMTGGGPVLLFHFEYEAPDRVRYTTVGTTGRTQETRLIGRDRLDREEGGPWTRSDLGFPLSVPHSEYARGAARAHIIGRDHDGAQDLLELAFVQSAATYYRIWVGAQDHLVRRYLMMTTGHYMTGTYSDYDAPLAITAP